MAPKRNTPLPADRPYHGFTLIELLVVIAIIAVLAALAIPITGSVLDNAGNTSDMSNLREIGTAISLFATENGRLPNASFNAATGERSSGSNPRNSFMDSVERSLPRDAAFNENSIYNWQRRSLWFSKRFAKKPDGKSIPNGQHYWGIAWGMNPFLYYNRSSANMNNFKGNLLKAPNLSKLVLVGEKNRNGGHDFRPDEEPSFEDDVETSYRISRNGKAYYLFADYHIEMIEGDQSLSAHPEYGSYDPTNRLYYKW